MSGSRSTLAIIGMAARFPGAADLEEFWDLLLGKRSVYGRLPPERLDRDLYYEPPPAKPGKTYTDIGGVIDDRELNIDRLGLDPNEVQNADISHLWLLDTALRSIADAGLDPVRFKDRRVGVFVGHVAGSARAHDRFYLSEIESLVSRLPEEPFLPGFPASELRSRLISKTCDRYPRDRYLPELNSEAHSVAALVAKRLQTSGPWMAVDAACASSFAALQMAAHWIAAGQIDMALVGGCSYTSWPSLVRFSQAQALSPTGSFPFDQRGDGFVSSDGYAAILVEPVERALARGHSIRSVLLSIGASCDGRGKSLWAPQKQGQLTALRRAYSDTLAPRSVQIVEAHATGTRVGDGVELETLDEVFGGIGNNRSLPVTAVKGNLGHTRETAGLAGLVKMVLSMEKGIFCPTANFDPESACDSIDWQSSPLRIVQNEESWPAQELRRCAVNSFGIGGINFHVVLGDPNHAGASGLRRTVQEEPTSRAPEIIAGTSNVDRSRAIAVIGVGCVLPNLHDARSFARNIERTAEFSPPDRETRWNAEIYSGRDREKIRVARPEANFLGDWKFDWRRHKMPPRLVDRSDPLQLALLEATAQALEGSGLDTDPAARDLVGVYAGTIFHTDYSIEIGISTRMAEFLRDVGSELQLSGLAQQQVESALQKIRLALEARYLRVDESGSYSASTLASGICKRFDLHGPCVAIDAAECSGAAALLEAVEALRQGDCDLAICCGGQRSLHQSRFERYEQQGWLEDAGSLHLAEGAVAFLLQRLEDVDPLSRQVLSVIDELHCWSAPELPWSALGKAQKQASGAVDMIQFFSDVEEQKQEKRLSGPCLKSNSITRSVNSRLGLTQGASSLVALLDSILAAPGLSARSGFIAAAINSVAFRGMAYHIRSRVSCAFPAFAAPSQPAPRVFQLQADSFPALCQKIEQAIEKPGQLPTRGSLEARDYDQLWRLGIVATHADELPAKLDLARRLASNPEHWPSLHEQGIFLHEGRSTPSLVAWIFPGQGSAYSGMFRSLLSAFPESRRVLNELNEILQDEGLERFEKKFWMPDSEARLATSIEFSQTGILMGSLLMAETLSSFGLRPDRVLGHSFGEYAALVTAGAWTPRTAFRAAAFRASILTRRAEAAGRLISTSASPRVINEIQTLYERDGHLSVANLNSPEQCVIAVETRLVDRLIRELEERGEVARLLPVPLPFHSQLLGAARPEFREALEPLTIQPPRIPLLSGVEERYLADPREIRRCLADQLVTPLNFIGLIERCWEDGIRIFIEIGPRSVVTRLVRSILKGRPGLALATDHPRIPAKEQLLRVQTLLKTQSGPSAEDSSVTSGSSVLPYRSTRTYPKPDPGPILHLDASRRGRKESTEPVSPASRVPAKGGGSALAPLDAVQREVVMLVCEQTGYPPEMVTVDLDIEADLGIDSLRKAQFLGELLDRRSKTPETASLDSIDLASILSVQDLVEIVREWEREEQSTESETTPAKSDRTARRRRSSESGRVFERWVLRTEVRPLSKAPAPARLRTLLFGRNLDDGTVAAGLEALGAGVICAETGSLVETETLARCGRIVILESAPKVRLGSSDGVLANEIESTLLPLFKNLQNWISVRRECRPEPPAELIAVTQMGGDFRATLEARAPFGGALAGLVRALSREFPELKAKVIDMTGLAEPQEQAQWLLDELCDPDFESGIGYAFDERIRLTPTSTSVSARGTWSALRNGGAWIISGGGRGITAFCALELARRHGMRIHLLGRTPPDPIPEEWLDLDAQDQRSLREKILQETGCRGEKATLLWQETKRRIELQRNLQTAARLGLQAEYHSVDIVEKDELSRIIEGIVARGHPIRGLMHGAGIEESGNFLSKQPELVQATLRTKVVGLQNLLSLIPKKDLSAVIGFGSLSGLFGGAGQADYSCASELLAKLLAAYRAETGVRCTTFHWPPWARLGMAARPESRFALEKAGRAFLEPEAGAAILLRELEAGLPESEVLIMEQEGQQAPREAISESSPRVEGPFELRSLAGDDSARIFEGVLDPARHPFLYDHQFDEKLLAPGVVSLELGAEAGLAGMGRQAFQFRDVRFERPLFFRGSSPLKLRVRVEAQSEGSQIEIFSTRLRESNGKSSGRRLWKAHFRRLREAADKTALDPPSEIDLQPVPYFASPNAAGQRRIFHGPLLQALRSLHLEEYGGWGLIHPDDRQLIPTVRPAWRLSPTALDACLLACGSWLYRKTGSPSIPVQLQELSVRSEAGPDLWVRFQCRERTAAEACFDFELGSGGGVVMQAYGFVLRTLGGVR